MSAPSPTTKSKSKSKKRKREELQPAASATPDRGEETSLERQAKPAFSPSLQHGGRGESPGMGPGPATAVVGSTEGVVEAAIPDGPSAEED
jgi:hypothetical protein